MKSLSIGVLIVLCLCASEIFAQGRKHVLVISAYHPAFPSFYKQNQGIRDSLKAQGFDEKNMDLDYEYMDSKRFNTEENLLNFSRSLAFKVSKLDYRYDVVMVADDNALDFALNQKYTLFNDIPIIFLGINNVKKAAMLEVDPQITGVVEKISIRETFNVIQAVHGSQITLQVVVDGTPTGQNNLRSVFDSQVASNQLALEILDLTQMSYEQLAEHLIDNKGNAVLLLSGYRDAKGATKSFYQMVSYVSERSASPVYHFWRHGVGDGLFGGKVISHYEQGRIAAKITAGLLSGKSVQDFPVIAESPNVNIFDYDQLNIFGISEALLPSDTQWINKPLSLKESNPIIFWSISSLILAGILIIFGLMWFIWLRKRVIDRLEDSYEKKSHLLTQAHSDLVHSEKMAALGRLVAGIAHEVNTPLGVSVTTTTHLQGLFSTLDNAYKSGELTRSQMELLLNEFSESGTILLHSVNSAARLISNFKQVAVDQSSEECREICLADYINAVVLSLKPKIKTKDVSVTVAGSREIALNTYPGALSQVVTNLIINSLVHGFEYKTNGCEIEIKVFEEKDGARVVYRDNGAGISAEIIKRVFEPFYTTKMGQGGSGLGLNIVYNLVMSKLEGQVTCDALNGDGAQFTFTLANIEKV